jgi:hypothetical protein
MVAVYMERVVLGEVSEAQREEFDALCEQAGAHLLRQREESRAWGMRLARMLEDEGEWSRHAAARRLSVHRLKLDRAARQERYERALRAWAVHQEAAQAQVALDPERELVSPLSFLAGVEAAAVPLIEIAERLERYYAAQAQAVAAAMPATRMARTLDGALVERALAMVGLPNAYLAHNTTQQRASRGLSKIRAWAAQDDEWSQLDRAVLERFIATLPSVHPRAHVA